MSVRSRAAAVALLALVVSAGCRAPAARVLTFSGSSVGREGDVIRRQIDRFHQENPSIAVAMRVTPDAADQRHQLYVQWLNGHAADPDVLQLDLVWTAEFAAAGWIAPLDRLSPLTADFFPAVAEAGRWRGALFAVPWFVDVGMLYWRTDLMPHAPGDFGALATTAQRAQRDHRVRFGLVWQGARYEGLVAVFVEYLGATGGRILDENGRVVVDSDAAVRALSLMRGELDGGIVPRAALTWQEEQARFAFQSGDAAFMRNWPYAVEPMEDAGSPIAGRFAVAPMPAAEGGRSSATLGGATLAINAFSDQPEDAAKLVAFLLAPAQTIERARITGQFPPSRRLFENGALEGALRIAPADAARVIGDAIARPVTPVYQELSEILQVSLHRALTGQQSPRDALGDAAASMKALLARTGLDREER